MRLKKYGVASKLSRDIPLDAKLANAHVPSHAWCSRVTDLVHQEILKSRQQNPPPEENTHEAGLPTCISYQDQVLR